MFTKILVRFVSTVGAAALGAVAAANILDVAAWKAAAAAAAVTAVPIVRNILIAYKDGKFSPAEVDAVFKDAE